MNFDWVQWYLVFYIFIGVFGTIILEGKPGLKQDRSFETYCAVILFALPYIGRVFEWW